jgi:hypothetical protein
MIKPHAKKKGRRTKVMTETELGEELTKRVRVIESKDTRSRSQIGTREIVQVVADTLERLTVKVDPVIDRLNAEDRALLVARMLIYGASDMGVKPVRVRVHDFGEPPFCEKHN